jgi:hypothetical protein
VVVVSVQQRVVDVDLDDDENDATVALELSIEDLFVEYNGQEFGLCTCKGYTHHEGPCAHLCYVRRQAAVDTSLMPTVDEDPQTEDLTDDVDIVETDPDEDDAGGDQEDVADVDPVEKDADQEADRADHAAPNTPGRHRTD